MRAEFTIAKKEIKDYFTSKRFLAIVAILFLLSTYSIIIGLNDYNTTLTAYKKAQVEVKNSDVYSQIMSSFAAKIADAEARNAQEEVAMWKGLMDSTENQPMPSILMVFSYFNQYFIFLGIALSIIIGFDAITKEKEEGTFKALLSHPFYRDSIINGKVIGATIVLLIVLAIVFLLTISILIINNVIPTTDEIYRIFTSYLLTVLFCVLFFSLAVVGSAFAKNSSTALTYLLGVVLLIYVYTQLTTPIVAYIMGPEPMSKDLLNSSITDTNTNNLIYDTKIVDYWNKYNLCSQIINMISPVYNYQVISTALVTNTITDMDSYRYIGINVLDALSYVTINIFALIVEIFVTFAIAYVKFMRMDIR